MALPVRARRGRSPVRLYAVLFGGIAMITVLALAVILKVPLYPAWVAGVSVVTFFAYGYDKGRAVRGGGRVPELVFHALALAGGFPGGWAGRAVFRHKTRKTSFLIVLVISTVIHFVLLLQVYVV